MPRLLTDLTAVLQSLFVVANVTNSTGAPQNYPYVLVRPGSIIINNGTPPNNKPFGSSAAFIGLRMPALDELIFCYEAGRAC